MTPERAQLFMELIDEIRTVEGGFIPNEAWMALHGLLPFPAVEVLVTRNEGREFVLVNRNDEYWNGWHIPGGHIRHGDSIPDTCNRVVREELGLAGITGLKQIAILKWEKHPFGGAPVSIVMVGHPMGTLKETDDIRFHSSVPTPMITNHDTFLGAYLNYLKTPHAGAQILNAA